METPSKMKSRFRTSDGYAYLTKRMIVQIAARAGKQASKEAMNLMGYVITVDTSREWVVKRYKNGREERVKRISQ